MYGTAAAAVALIASDREWQYIVVTGTGQGQQKARVVSVVDRQGGLGRRPGGQSSCLFACRRGRVKATSARSEYCLSKPNPQVASGCLDLK